MGSNRRVAVDDLATMEAAQPKRNQNLTARIARIHADSGLLFMCESKKEMNGFKQSAKVYWFCK